MTTLTVSEFRSDISKAVKAAQKNAVSISKHGEEIAVLISASMYEKMLNALEELEDIATFDEAMSGKDESVPWEKARKDLGLA
jgi:prevent-host-death family protein